MTMIKFHLPLTQNPSLFRTWKYFNSFLRAARIKPRLWQTDCFQLQLAVANGCHHLCTLSAFALALHKSERFVLHLKGRTVQWSHLKAVLFPAELVGEISRQFRTLEILRFEFVRIGPILPSPLCSSVLKPDLEINNPSLTHWVLTLVEVYFARPTA